MVDIEGSAGMALCRRERGREKGRRWKRIERKRKGRWEGGREGEEGEEGGQWMMAVCVCQSIL